MHSICLVYLLKRVTFSWPDHGSRVGVKCVNGERLGDLKLEGTFHASPEIRLMNVNFSIVHVSTFSFGEQRHYCVKNDSFEWKCQLPRSAN